MSLDFNPSGANEDADLGANLNYPRNIAGATLSCFLSLEDTPPLPNNNQIISFEVGAGGGNTRFEVQLDTSGRVEVFARAPDTDPAQIAVSTNPIPTTSTLKPEHHLIVVCDVANDEIRIYIDGVLDSTTAVAFTNAAFDNTTTNDRNVIANNIASTGSQPYDGKLADIRLYNRAMSDGECRTLNFMNGHDGLVEDLADRWLLNFEGSGNATVADFLDSSAARVIGEPVAIDGTPSYNDDRATYRRVVH